jgi:hypothetical protein
LLVKHDGLFVKHDGLFEKEKITNQTRVTGGVTGENGGVLEKARVEPAPKHLCPAMTAL